MQVYDTNSFTEEYRTAEHNGARQFSRCEHCNHEVNAKSQYIGIVYRHRYKKILCDRCTDNYDCSTIWSDEYAAKQGLPPFKPRWQK
jgi:uncharacterized protein with PIN domain